jgi:hypothetical protein
MTFGLEVLNAKRHVRDVLPVSSQLNGYGGKMLNSTHSAVVSSDSMDNHALVDKLRLENAERVDKNHVNDLTSVQPSGVGVSVGGGVVGDQPKDRGSAHWGDPGVLQVNLFGFDIGIGAWQLLGVPFVAVMLCFLCCMSAPLDERGNAIHGIHGVFRLCVEYFLVIALSSVGVASVSLLWKAGYLGDDSAIVKHVAFAGFCIVVLLSAVAVMHNRFVALRCDIEKRLAEIEKVKEEAQGRSNKGSPWCISPSGLLSSFKGRRSKQQPPKATSSQSVDDGPIPDPRIHEPKPSGERESEWKAVATKFRLDEVIDTVRRWDWIVPFLTQTGMSAVKQLECIPRETCTVSGTKQTIMGPVTPKITYTLQENTDMIEIISRAVTADAPVKGFVVEGRIRITATEDASEVRSKTTIFWLESGGWLASTVESTAINEAEAGLETFVELISPPST